VSAHPPLQENIQENNPEKEMKRYQKRTEKDCCVGQEGKITKKIHRTKPAM
jgi:hypothetical protein